MLTILVSLALQPLALVTVTIYLPEVFTFIVLVVLLGGEVTVFREEASSWTLVKQK